MSRREILYELPMSQAWAFYAWSLENDPWINAERKAKGYIAQEIDRLKTI